VKISGSETKQVGKFTYLGSVVEKNGKIPNEINESIRNASQFCHLIKSILWNKDKGRVKLRYTRCTLRIYCYTEQRHGHVLRERKGKHKPLRRNF
jgi:hypothetical protein